MSAVDQCQINGYRYQVLENFFKVRESIQKIHINRLHGLGKA